MELERAGKLVVSKALVFLGDASYSIYLVHQPAISLIAKLLYPLWLRVKVPLIVPFMLMVVGSVALGVLIHLFVEQPLLRLVRTPESWLTVRRRIQGAAQRSAHDGFGVIVALLKAGNGRAKVRPR
jgi:peptidoglycan/LPS O-acetylase OafA/YrhL